VLADAGYRKRKSRGSALVDLWEKAAGPELADRTRPYALLHGVLTVEVRGAALLAELAGFRRDELLARLATADPSGRVTGLRFRAGTF
jgi:hypothetical protein